MIISLVAAIGKHRQLGLNGKLPWKIGKDMDHFKNLTMSHHILMGRKTFESLGRPLPGRQNIVITRDASFSAGGCHVFLSPKDAVKFAESNNETELFVIGGATIYNFFMRNKLLDRMYITEVDYDGEADAFFPEFNLENWQLEQCSYFEKDYKNDYFGRILMMNKVKN
ncbi:MAG: dihydrofolate reductase [Rickettsiales bacterium]|jgi:dihydrofolate reductase|nr:dihydrofolate reductase [Rickettsiales bacterium]